MAHETRDTNKDRMLRLVKEISDEPSMEPDFELFSIDDMDEYFTVSPRQYRHHHLSRVSTVVTVYISGWVVVSLRKSIKCEQCNDVLSDPAEAEIKLLIKVKSKGKLTYPSNDVIDVCVTAEKAFRHRVYSAGENPYDFANPYKALSKHCYHQVMCDVLSVYRDKHIFTCLDSHMKDTHPLENHVIYLIKAISEKYLQCRYHYAAKQHQKLVLSRVNAQSRAVSTHITTLTGQ